jgi:twitching motility protein PilT
VNPLLDQVLQTARQLGASDVHLKVGLPPVFRIKGDLRTVRDSLALSADVMSTFAINLMTATQKEQFEIDKDLDLAYVDEKKQRYRVNIYQQRGQYGIALRVVPSEVPPFESLMLPEAVLKLAQETRGLVLLTGATGSGKSTTLAAMIDYINKNRAAHILTIEDPIEYVHHDARSIINQRELDIDATTFGRALRAALRQDPDVILVGEMRDLETMETAITAAETGHLVLSTLHTVDAVETINRILSNFPPHQQPTLRIQLASVLRGVISQRLVTRADGKGMVPAVEVMVNTQRVRELIENPQRTREIHEAISTGRHPYGMVSFDQSLTDLVKRRLVTYEEALRNATRPDDFALAFRGVASGTAAEAVRPPPPPPSKADMEIDRFGK